MHTPLGDDAALAVGKRFGVDHMIEHVARARRRAVGAMFPADLASSPAGRQASQSSGW